MSLVIVIDLNRSPEHECACTRHMQCEQVEDD